MQNSIIITGAAGFIGSSFVDLAIQNFDKVIVLDALTYAGHKDNLAHHSDNPKFHFAHADIRDTQNTLSLLKEYKVQALVNFAAESHVDNSITGPNTFIETNVIGSFALLEASRKYIQELKTDEKTNFRFLHVSTDEVYGSLTDNGKFTENSPYAPNSPYSASKAASDHLVRAWNHTYGLYTITTNCSNNYGPRQYPEKLIPRMIQCALSNEALPVYGQGHNVRDWIHVEDHCRGIMLALKNGKSGETYCFGGNSERNNLQVVNSICSILDELAPRKDNKPHSSHIQFVTDRLGHDWRYAIDDSKAQKELGFKHSYQSFELGLKATVQWYLNNQEWVLSVQKKKS